MKITDMKWEPFGKNYLNISNAELDKALRHYAGALPDIRPAKSEFYF